jgi:hypothetical protein
MQKHGVEKFLRFLRARFPSPPTYIGYVSHALRLCPRPLENTGACVTTQLENILVLYKLFCI